MAISPADAERAHAERISPKADTFEREVDEHLTTKPPSVDGCWYIDTIGHDPQVVAEVQHRFSATGWEVSIDFDRDGNYTRLKPRVAGQRD